ncbi:MAG: hypothetical protein PHW62_01585 [Candidatus Ratteibacteria bacterium]|nr:hypothetical protein [Candidatus Ratteibacteria bacterium]
MKFESDGQAAAWYHNQILRIQHGKRTYSKRYLTDEQVLAVFDGEVRVEEKVDGKLSVRLRSTEHHCQEYWVAEEMYSKNTVHNHVIKYSGAPHQIWLNKILMEYGLPSITDILEKQNTLGYGTIKLKDPTIEQIHNLLECFARLPSHYGAPKIEGLVLKNMEKQKFAKWINEEFEDKIEESENQ